MRKGTYHVNPRRRSFLIGHDFYDFSSVIDVGVCSTLIKHAHCVAYSRIKRLTMFRIEFDEFSDPIFGHYCWGCYVYSSDLFFFFFSREYELIFSTNKKVLCKIVVIRERYLGIRIRLPWSWWNEYLTQKGKHDSWIWFPICPRACYIVVSRVHWVDGNWSFLSFSIFIFQLSKGTCVWIAVSTRLLNTECVQDSCCSP